MSQPARKSPGPALALAFFPAALVLVVGAFGGQSGPDQSVIWIVCGVCLVCCFVSSFLLFRQRTVWSIVCGLCFLILNLGISLFAGCVAIVKGMRF